MRSRSVLKAILWLHLIRLSRFKYSFINMIIVDMLWYMIFLLGALTFVEPSRFAEVSAITFWGIIAWSLMNNSVWLVSGWTWFVLAMRLVDEHMLHNVNPIAFIAGRIVTVASVTAASVPLVALILTATIGLHIPWPANPLVLVAGFLLMAAYSLLYSIILAALSLRTSIPGPMLDITNIFMYIIGGFGVPVSMMPRYLRSAALLVPYTHAAELIRLGALGTHPYLGVGTEAAASLAYLAAMLAAAYLVSARVTRYIRIHGARAIGRM